METLVRIEERRPLKGILVLKGVLEVFEYAMRSFFANGGFNQAASLSFFTILSLVPFLLLLLSLSGFLLELIPGSEEGILPLLERSFPYLKELIYNELTFIIKNRELFGYVGFISLLWTASLIFSSLEQAFSSIFKSKKRRHYFHSKLLSFLMLPLGIMIFILSVVISVIVGWIGEFVFVFFGIESLVPFVQNLVIVYLIPLVLLSFFFTLVFKIIPEARIPFFQAFVTGFACSVWTVLANFAFAWYVNHAAHYSIIYGSMGAVIVFLLLYYNISIILLFCGECLSAYRRRNLILLKKAFV